MTDTRPTLARDRAFHGMVATQFLGAFNDNVFKQLVLLLGLDYMANQRLQKDPYQTISMILFSLGFILFSGFAGWLSDRYSKRRIIVLSKVAEIVVMALGALAFYFTPDLSAAQMTFLIVILFFMGTQSAFFGPSKYGILPELFRDRDLPIANGIIQMTTFLAIIFGTAVCGILKEYLEDQGIGLWTVSATCIGIAIVGTLSSMMLRPTPPAQPGLKFQPASLAMDRSTFMLLWNDKKLFQVMGAIILFWFLGGMVLPVANTLGKEQFALGDTWTSGLTACIALGIAAGCMISGAASRTRINFKFVIAGAWGMCISMTLLAVVPQFISPDQEVLEFRRADALRTAARYESAIDAYSQLLKTHDEMLEGWIGMGLAHQGFESDAAAVAADVDHHAEAQAAFDRAKQLDPAIEIPSEPNADFAAHVGADELFPVKVMMALLLIAMGVSSGVFAVPLQVFLQHRPPRELKGRMIAAMNLLTWIGIFLSAPAYFACSHQFTSQHITWSFLVMAALILPVALFYRPENEELKFE